MFQIAVERLKKGWSQKELARRAGIDAPLLSRLETGIMKPYPRWRKKLATALEVPEEILFLEVQTYAPNTAPDSN
ncbi:MAG: helix-turn-helix domain-containing protein [Candidatus Xenobiia bacterium LiM19]